MAPVIHKHSSLSYHTTFIQMTQGLLISAHNFSTYIHHFVLETCFVQQVEEVKMPCWFHFEWKGQVFLVMINRTRGVRHWHMSQLANLLPTASLEKQIVVGVVIIIILNILLLLHIVYMFPSHWPWGLLRTQKLKSHLMRTQSLKVLPLKSGVGQYISMRSTLTARDFFFANFYPSGPFASIFFPKPLPSFSCISCG